MSEYKRLKEKLESILTLPELPFEEDLTAVDCKQMYDIICKIEQGTLIELPCKYGELLFCVVSDRDSISRKIYRHIEACRVDEIMIFRSGCFVIGVREVNTGYGHNGTLGDTLFRTFEEAEKRSKELQEND